MTVNSSDLLDYSNQFADDYDRLARESEWFGGDALFGMMYQYIGAGEQLIDLGIGTGLGAQPFHRAGLKVYGLDISRPMLKQCEAKEITGDLRVHDLRESLPYGDCEFDHAIAVGVFHFIKELGPLIQEASRVIRPGGIFGCTSFCPEDESRDVSEERVHGFTIYQHSHRFVVSVMQEQGFQVLKTTRFTYYSDPSRSVQITNRIYVFHKAQGDPL
jgi:predicted TPR repeat methyltransferase